MLRQAAKCKEIGFRSRLQKGRGVEAKMVDVEAAKWQGCWDGFNMLRLRQANRQKGIALSTNTGGCRAKRQIKRLPTEEQCLKLLLFFALFSYPIS